MNIVFFSAAFIFSCFYGFGSQKIWFPKEEVNRVKLIHEIWFNFFSSFLGWICLYAVYISLSIVPPTDLVRSISWQHLILSLIASLGITGLLPYTLWGISRTPAEIMKKAIGWLGGEK
jgi:hypothetical protein